MRMFVLSPILFFFFTACTNTHAGAYIIDAAPLWHLAPTAVPGPSPEAVASPLSATATVDSSVVASPSKRHKHGPTETATATATVSPTPTLTATQPMGLYLVPFQDKRRNPEIWSGRSMYEKVIVEPSGATTLAQTWQKRPFSNMSYFWHRQFAYALGSSGYAVTSADMPMLDEKAALEAAHAAGAKVLIEGQIRRLNMVKKGADDFLGTNFSGTNYYLNLEIQLKTIDIESGNVTIDKVVECQRAFYDPTRLGANDRDTFPRFFATGLPELALKVAGDEKLLQVAGLPTFTATPTKTATPEVRAPKPGDTPTIEPTATPDTGPYWINPKTGNKVDPSWNFDPADGTPRDKFILRQSGTKKPGRPTEAK